MLLVRLKGAKVDLVNAVNDKRLPGTAVETGIVLLCFRNSSENQPANRHLFLEVKVLTIAQLVKASTNWSVVTYLDKASCFADIRHITEHKGIFRKD